MEHFLEPDFNKCFSGSVLDFNTFHSHKCLGIEHFSFAVDFDQIKIDSGNYFIDLLVLIFLLQMEVFS